MDKLPILIATLGTSFPNKKDDLIIESMMKKGISG